MGVTCGVRGRCEVFRMHSVHLAGVEFTGLGFLGGATFFVALALQEMVSSVER
jgi:hypothetical protein